jgi:hypothetical protein
MDLRWATGCVVGGGGGKLEVSPIWASISMTGNMHQRNEQSEVLPQGSEAQPAPSPGTPLATELAGDLPCVRCRYNLRGLSIVSCCPECGTPMRATLLAVVDPRASELLPIVAPGLTSVGVVLWGTAAMGAAAVALLSHLVSLGLFPALEVLSLWSLVMAGEWVVALTILSGLGAVAFIRPHAGIAAAKVRLAALGVAGYIPVCMCVWWLNAYGALMSVSPLRLQTPQGAPAGVWLVLCLLVVGVLLCLRPNARLLVARSMLMRSGQVDRQTMRGLASVSMVSAAGVLLGLLSGLVEAPVMDTVETVGALVILVGWLLFLIGLGGVTVDCWRLRPVIAATPLSLSDLLDPARAGASRPSRMWSQSP